MQANVRVSFYRLPAIDMMQSIVAMAISIKDNHSSDLHIVSTFGPPLVPNSIVEFNNRIAIAMAKAMIAIITICVPGPNCTIAIDVTKQNKSKKMLPQVRYIL